MLRAEEPKAAAAEEIEDIEEIEEIEDIEYFEEIEAVEAGDGAMEESLGLLEGFGRFHPALIHFPIAWLFLLLFVDALTFIGGQMALLGVGKNLSFLTWLSFFPAAASGYWRMDALPEDPAAILHRNIMLMAFSLMGLAAALRMKYGDQIREHRTYLYCGLILVAGLLVGYGAHLGGELIYGEDFFPF